jgi:hypothetical protein
MQEAVAMLEKLRDRGLSLILFRNQAMDSSTLGQVVIIGVDASENLGSLKNAPDGDWGTGWKFLQEKAWSKGRITDEVIKELAGEAVKGGWIDNHVWQLPGQQDVQ